MRGGSSLICRRFLRRIERLSTCSCFTVKFEPQSGITIAPILFIVAVLAILAAAIAAGSGSFTGGTSTESATTKAAAIRNYADLVASATQRVIIENQCDPTQVRFSNPIATQEAGSDIYANPNSPANGSCNVFGIGGGNITSQAPMEQFTGPNYAIMYLFSGNEEIVGAGSTCGNINCTDIAMGVQVCICSTRCEHGLA